MSEAEVVAQSFEILTLFPEFFDSPLRATLLGKAIANGVVTVDVTDIRSFTTDKHRMADDTPYGGGSGMVMKPEPLVAAIEAAQERLPGARRVLLTPRGRPLDQQLVHEFAEAPALVLVCGHYEGVDQRIEVAIDDEVSIGDYVLAGGEVAALVLLEAVARLRPGFVGNARSIEEESFSEPLLEYPQFTRPETFRGQAVPAVLRSGHHAEIARWRRKESLRTTRDRRPDLLEAAELSAEDLKLLADLELESE